MALVAAGLTALGVALLPPRPGNLDWEFGAFGEAAATAPLLLIGLGAALFVATRRKGARVLFGLALLSWLTALLFAGAAVMLLLDWPLILAAARSTTTEQAQTLKIALAKSQALLLIEATAFAAFGVAGSRWWSAVRKTST